MKQNSSQWMPFNSLFNGNEEKDKIVVINKKKPILSEEQIALAAGNQQADH